jgi:hypothetical protein
LTSILAATHEKVTKENHCSSCYVIRPA